MLVNIMERYMLNKITKIAVVGAIAALSIGNLFAGELKLRIGVEGAFPPFSEKAADGSLIGFDVDIANALCQKMNTECKIIEQDWDGMIPGLLARKYDAIIASMTITEERKKRIDFSDKYYNTPAKFAAKSGAFSDDSPATLAGKTIGVARATTHDDFLTKLYPDSNIKRYPSQDDVYLDMLSGRLDAMFGDSIAQSDGFIKTDDGKGYAFFGKSYTTPKSIFGIGAGVAVRKGEEKLRDAFSKAIADIRADGTYAKINGKYFKFDIYGD